MASLIEAAVKDTTSTNGGTQARQSTKRITGDGSDTGMYFEVLCDGDSVGYWCGGTPCAGADSAIAQVNFDGHILWLQNWNSNRSKGVRR